jgi:hypothetical protein
MKRPKTLPVFTNDEYEKMHHLLATKVAIMMGRKFEEDDWADVYCRAKGIPNTGWSNLAIDIMHQGLGVEHKQLKVKSNRNIQTHCGERKMHPSLTRSIRIPSIDVDANQAMRDVLTQYGELIRSRSEQVKKTSPTSHVDIRTGWLLWQETLEEFLYFEEELTIPDPNEYYAEWRESTSNSNRKNSINLWIYELETGIKRYSITTSAGAKIQGYFDIPPPNDPNLYFFRVQGEQITQTEIRIWIMPTTKRELERILGDLSPQKLSMLILEIANQDLVVESQPSEAFELAVPLIIQASAYDVLRNTFNGVSDEHIIRSLVEYLHKNH